MLILSIFPNVEKCFFKKSSDILYPETNMVLPLMVLVSGFVGIGFSVLVSLSEAETKLSYRPLIFCLGGSCSSSSCCVAEKGWYELTVLSVLFNFLSNPRGLLKACSGRFGVFGAVITPDFINFLATSRASRASVGCFGVEGALSGSDLGDFKSCKAFFWKVKNYGCTILSY